MRNIDEDTITQAVIARHAGADDPRLREVMTSLVQHLHAFARDVKLTEAEWAEGVRFIAECGQATLPGRPEVTLLSHTLGLTALVTAVSQRRPKGCTESTVPYRGEEDAGEPCYLRGRVRAADGTPIANAEVCIGRCDDDNNDNNGTAPRDVLRTDADGGFLVKTTAAAAQPIARHGPVGRLLQAMGRHPWRPAHLHVTISAPGYTRLVTQVFRQGDPYLDSDAVFGVRSSLVADWLRHEPGLTPDGHGSAVPFTTLDFTFVLNATTGDKP